MAETASEPVSTAQVASDTTSRAVLPRPVGRWVAQDWSMLPGWGQDAMAEAWPAWQKSCARPSPVWQGLCREVLALAQASPQRQRQFIESRLQPYQVQAPSGATEGLLTAYYEPEMQAHRLPRGAFVHPVHAPPDGLAARKPWYTRQQMEQVPEARAALQGKEIAYLAHPVDVLVLQIQGSGLLRLTESDGLVRQVRLAYAATNDQPYRSIGRWMLDQGLIRDASWPGIQAWLQAHPQRLSEVLGQNPRVVFFREESLPEGAALPGPRGAQGVPLTAGRSIAVDPGSIPYGSPVWLVSAGPTQALQRLVLAQDTGNAITGAVRADYFVGTGAIAGDLAGRLKQNLSMWVLWPRP